MPQKGRTPPAADAWAAWAAWIPTLAPVESPQTAMEAPLVPQPLTRDNIQRITNWLFRSGYLKFTAEGDIALGPLAHKQSITNLKQSIPNLKTLQKAYGSILLLDDAEVQAAIELLQREDILLVSPRGLLRPAEESADYCQLAHLAHNLNLAIEGWALQTKQPVPNHQITISAVLQFEQRVREAYDQPPAGEEPEP